MADDQLSDFWDFLKEDGFTTPVLPSEAHPEGRQYKVPSPNAKDGARMAALLSIATRQEAHKRGIDAGEVTSEEVGRLRMEGDDERSFMGQVLGSAYSEMLADGVKWEIITKLSQFAFVYWTQGRSAAEEAAAKGLIGGGKVRAVETPPTTSKASRNRTGSTRTSRTTTKR